MKTVPHPSALVGFSTSEGAAVYRLSPGLALVNTVGFFPPLVDDPFSSGEIAAAHALSDIYAMGARPLFALNVVGSPADQPLKVLSRLLAGGQAKAEEAGIPLLGGRSVHDPEPKYGLAVTGAVHPKRVLTHAGAKPGDILLLTKPLGSGIATTAMKRGVASRELCKRVVELMSRLNRAAGETFASRAFAVNALACVMGSGLLGHLLEMMTASKTRARLYLENVPILAGVPALSAQGVVPGGTKSNLEQVGRRVRFPAGLPDDIRLVLADAQTNGGLLASVPMKQGAKAVRALEKSGVEAAPVGEVVAGRPGIQVVG